VQSVGLAACFESFA